MYLEQDNLVNPEVYESIQDVAFCSICCGIVIDPLQCSKCENCFCKNCINIWKKRDSSCPYKCSNIEFKEPSRIIKNMLNKLIFNCPFNCDKKINYDDLISHETKCVSEQVTCPCCKTLVPKNTIDKKSFDKMSIELEIVTKKLEEMNSENQLIKSELEKFKDIKSSTRDEIRMSLQELSNNTNNNTNNRNDKYKDNRDSKEERDRKRNERDRERNNRIKNFQKDNKGGNISFNLSR